MKATDFNSFSMYTQLWLQTNRHVSFHTVTAVPSFPPLLWKRTPGNIFPRLHVPACRALCVNCRFFTQTRSLARSSTLENLSEGIYTSLWWQHFPIIVTSKQLIADTRGRWKLLAGSLGPFWRKPTLILLQHIEQETREYSPIWPSLIISL